MGGGGRRRRSRRSRRSKASNFCTLKQLDECKDPVVDPDDGVVCSELDKKGCKSEQNLQVQQEERLQEQVNRFDLFWLFPTYRGNGGVRFCLFTIGNIISPTRPATIKIFCIERKIWILAAWWCFFVVFGRTHRSKR